MPSVSLGRSHNCSHSFLNSLLPRHEATLEATGDFPTMTTFHSNTRVSFLIVLCLLLAVVLGCKLLGGLPKKVAMFEGNAVPDGIAEFKRKIGGSFKVLSLDIKEDEMTLEAQDPKNPQHVDAYRYSMGLVSGPTPVNLSKLINNDLNQNVFSLDEVDISAIPGLIKASIQRTDLEGGKVSSMRLSRGLMLPELTLGPPQWSIHVGGPRGDATLYANSKGEILKINKL
jgi:hypothetical protein